MRESLPIGSAPYGEECAQVGEENYRQKARKQCRAFINQLYRFLEAKGYKKLELPQGFGFFIQSHSHDFGLYYEVACKFDSQDEKSVELACLLEEACPESWDTEARKELQLDNQELESEL